MREYIRKHTASGPFATHDPVARLVAFFEENGYELVASAHGAQPDGLPVVEDETGEAGDAEVSEQAEAEEGEEAHEGEEGEDSDAGEEPEDATDDEGAEESEESEESEETGEVMVQATLERGEKGAGLRTSNMTRLYSRVSVKLRDHKVLVDYLVDASWQVFNEDDERFWTREAESAIKYAEGRGALRDFRPGEEERAKEIRGDFTMMGTWLAIVVFFLIFAFFLMMR